MKGILNGMKLSRVCTKLNTFLTKQSFMYCAEGTACWGRLAQASSDISKRAVQRCTGNIDMSKEYLVKDDIWMRKERQRRFCR